MSRRARHTLRALLALAVLATACRRPPQPIVETGGDASRGRTLIAAYDCGACHVIPGIRGARGVIGPPLTGFALRSYVGGRTPNTPENLVHWIQDPNALSPGTAMPSLGIGPQEARDVAAYLYVLR